MMDDNTGGKARNYATRCRGQLNALLPEVARPSFDYSAKQT